MNESGLDKSQRFVLYAQVVSTIGAIIAAYDAHSAAKLVESEVASLAIARESLTAQQHAADEQKRAIDYARAPFLAFDPVTHEVAIDTSQSIQALAFERVRDGGLPTLRNFGSGPSFNIKVEWRLEQSVAVHPFGVSRPHLFPKEEATVFSIDRELFDTSDVPISGFVLLTYNDIDGKVRKTRQSFSIRRRTSAETHLITFGDIDLPYDHSQWAGPQLMNYELPNQLPQIQDSQGIIDLPMMLTKGELADHFRISERQLDRLREKRLIPAPFTTLGFPRWSRKAIANWIDDGCQPPGDDMQQC